MDEEKRNEIQEKTKILKEKIKKERKGFCADFKAFITKGNVLDLAVAVVVGAAFGAITSGLVSYIINPVISLLTNGISLDGFRTPLGEKIVDDLGNVTYANYIEWGKWLQTIIDFLIISFAVFVAVRVIKKAENTLRAKELAQAAKKKAEADAKAKAEADVAAQKAEEEKAILDEYYRNVKEQSQLLREIKDLIQQNK